MTLPQVGRTFSTMHGAMQPAEVGKIRKAMGMTQAEFGAYVGVTETTVWRWENEHRRVPGPTAQLLRRMLADVTSQPVPAA